MLILCEGERTVPESPVQLGYRFAPAFLPHHQRNRTESVRVPSGTTLDPLAEWEVSTKLGFEPIERSRRHLDGHAARVALPA
jgi:hypothetical protein